MKSSRSANSVAVALEYVPNLHRAPKVVASGTVNQAREIVRLARRRAIPIEIRQELAPRLAEIRCADTIPPELYEEVAGILAEYKEFS